MIPAKTWRRLLYPDWMKLNRLTPKRKQRIERKVCEDIAFIMGHRIRWLRNGHAAIFPADGPDDPKSHCATRYLWSTKQVKEYLLRQARCYIVPERAADYSEALWLVKQLVGEG